MEQLVFERKWAEAVKGLPDKDRLNVYDAIMNYAFAGEPGDLTPIASVAFAFIRQDIDGRKAGKKRGNPAFRKGETNPYYRGGKNPDKDNSEIIQDNNYDNSDNNYPNYPDSGAEEPAKIAATDNSGAIQDNSDNNYPIIPASRARAINQPPVFIDNLDINNKFLNINIPESDSKLISPVDNLDSDNNFDGDKLKSLEENLESSSQVLEYKQEDKLKNKRDNTTHVREENSAPQAPDPEKAVTVRKPETMEEKRAKCGMRKQKFKDELEAYAQSYPADMLRDFFDYWTEMNKSRTMMRFEQQKTWETRLRLATWARRDEARGKPRKRGSTILEAVSAVARSIEDDKKNKGKRIDFNKLLNG